MAWPQKEDFVMNVLGFREAVDNAIQIDIGEGVVVPVVSLPALALLKLLAWHDRRARGNKDAFDLRLILTLPNYLEAAEERIWEIAGDLLTAYEFDVDLAASALFGREARSIALSGSRNAVISFLTDEQT
ncbi:nucleotidyl transferase AbiEii/AbiGii toxin family protein [Paraburkholderia sp. RL17-337-BIB-A]|uniref:nucleotidyl transferase AbiEii/AbiGii toxin family protein n=1 Tax=Paraburkholderia sp. RL17-337-BIB-A TaxID=3031636 RepID=UPI0038BB8C3D